MLGRENSKYARVNGFLLDKSIKISISQDSYDNFGFRPQFRHQDTIYSGFLVIIYILCVFFLDFDLNLDIKDTIYCVFPISNYILCVFLINLLKDRLRLNSEDFCQTAGTKNIKSMFIGFFVESQMVSASNVEPISTFYFGITTIKLKNISYCSCIIIKFYFLILI